MNVQQSHEFLASACREVSAGQLTNERVADLRCQIAQLQQNDRLMLAFSQAYRASGLRRITVDELEPRLLCFGHGPPLRDRQQLDRFVKRLPVES